MTKKATLDDEQREDDRRDRPAQPSPKARARRATGPTTSDGRPSAPAALASGRSARIPEQPVEARRERTTWANRHEPGEVEPDRHEQPGQRARPGEQQVDAGPDEEREARRPMSPARSSAGRRRRPGRRGATTRAAIPAAVAPIVPDWNAHRMSSPPEPRTSMTAIAPSAQPAALSPPDDDVDDPGDREVEREGHRPGTASTRPSRPSRAGRGRGSRASRSGARCAARRCPGSTGRAAG